MKVNEIDGCATDWDSVSVERSFVEWKVEFGWFLFMSFLWDMKLPTE